MKTRATSRSQIYNTRHKVVVSDYRCKQAIAKEKKKTKTKAEQLQWRRSKVVEMGN